ncbi:pentatricopeptide repeat-containing protein At3g02490, mitochondrial-like [Aristolochia californica]|uniref:pentatricopeptide repeat-containing protein At3g02490, mitochondrial-like n=1 Tax=Aristolochia californica TaxID=171875 RepID=UPI0035DBBD58
MTTAWRLIHLRRFSRVATQCRSAPLLKRVTTLDSPVSSAFPSFITNHCRADVAFGPSGISGRSTYRLFSSELAMERENLDHARLAEIFSKKSSSDEITKEVQSLGLPLDHEEIVSVLLSLREKTEVAQRFFDWVLETDGEKLGSKSYNVMLGLLGSKGCVKEFWDMVDKMTNKGHLMEIETYIEVLGRFFKRKMLKEAVDLYDFMMSGPNKPPVQDSVFLLKKIVASKDLDMELFSRVIRIFTTGGNHLSKRNFDSVLKSLTSSGKLGECDKILEAMEEGGFVPNRTVYGEVVSGLCKAGKVDEAAHFLDNLEKCGQSADLKLWVSLIDGFCAANEVDQAIHWFDTLLDKKGMEVGGSALEVLINGFYRVHGPQDACKFLVKTVKEKQLKPWHSTYKIMIDRLLQKEKLKDAMDLLGLMRTNGFPPFADPFIGYISKQGTGEDAINFLKAMTIKRFPSMSVFLLVFKGLLEQGRHNVAHDLLSLSPRYIRSHVDVLDLFASLKINTDALHSVA